jgi:hypothetical protein
MFEELGWMILAKSYRYYDKINAINNQLNDYTNLYYIN